jgi:ribonuclease-3
LEALTHSSFANESPQVSPRDNERLEYLGDAVLQLITAEHLFKLRPDAKEGEMTQTRSAMVNTNTLAALGEELGLGEFLYLGRGIARGGGRSLKSLLANAFEAVLGAIFLDAGYDAAYHYFLGAFRSLPEPVQDENHKGRLQQIVQERYGQTPYYDSAGARGGRHREYTAVVYVGSEPLGTGHGSTKQAAEQEAAKNAVAEIARRETDRAAGRRRRPSPTVPRPAGEGAGAVSAVATPAAGPAPTPSPEAPVPPTESAEPQGEVAPAAPPRPRRRRREAAASERPPPRSSPARGEGDAPAAGEGVAPPAPADEPAAPRSRRRRKPADAGVEASGLPLY